VIAVTSVWIPALESWPCHAVVRASLEARFQGFCFEYTTVTVTHGSGMGTVTISVDALVVVCQSLKPLGAK